VESTLPGIGGVGSADNGDRTSVYRRLLPEHRLSSREERDMEREACGSGATYSGVFTLYPLISGEGRIHHGEKLPQASSLADAGKLCPLLYKESPDIRDIGIAHDLVASGTLGKVIVEL
jgi:hypothetical protein